MFVVCFSFICGGSFHHLSSQHSSQQPTSFTQSKQSPAADITTNTLSTAIAVSALTTKDHSLTIALMMALGWCALAMTALALLSFSPIAKAANTSTPNSTVCIQSLFHDKSFVSTLDDATKETMAPFPLSSAGAAFKYFPTDSKASPLVLGVLAWTLSMPESRHNNRHHCVELCDTGDCGMYSNFLSSIGCFTDVYSDSKETQDKMVYSSVANTIENKLHVHPIHGESSHSCECFKSRNYTVAYLTLGASSTTAGSTTTAANAEAATASPPSWLTATTAGTTTAANAEAATNSPPSWLTNGLDRLSNGEGSSVATIIMSTTWGYLRSRSSEVMDTIFKSFRYYIIHECDVEADPGWTWLELSNIRFS
jgi:hypothetical protein